LPDSQVTVAAATFALKLKQKYPQYASTEDEHLIAVFVTKYPQYHVTYEGKKPVSVSWERASASAAEETHFDTLQGLVTGHDHFDVRPPARTNRRAYPRIPFRKTKACVKSQGVPDVIVDVVDISRGGICFVSAEQFYVGTPVSVAPHYIEGGLNIFQDGRIVRVHHGESDCLTDMLLTEYAVEY